jgi:hypothetical protein
MMTARSGREIDRDSLAPQDDVQPPRIKGDDICETCDHGRVIRTREPRSPVLRVVGFTLWADALLTLILGMGPGPLFVSGTGNATAEAIRRHRSDATAALVQVTSIPRSTIDTFDETGTFDETVLAHLAAGERSRTDRILEIYRNAVDGEIASGARRSIRIPAACLLLFAAGLFLTLKRDVWRCSTCGHVTRIMRRGPTSFPSVMSPRTD